MCYPCDVWEWTRHVMIHSNDQLVHVLIKDVDCFIHMKEKYCNQLYALYCLKCISMGLFMTIYTNNIVGWITGYFTETSFQLAISVIFL